ncbi:hypothetical protein HPULCUR_008572 [Helicostylum pulchrum]|uniref:Uncharacterized protein n=1 Tax=Helicostylum pulchrum TaxID=562976 RepID=A0ABP9Y7Y5_9FUNG
MQASQEQSVPEHTFDSDWGSYGGDEAWMGDVDDPSLAGGFPETGVTEPLEQIVRSKCLALHQFSAYINAFYLTCMSY